MGITRDSMHKRRNTGGKRAHFRKKRKFELGRPAANTRIGEPRVHSVRCRGGHLKHRALRLDAGNFAWGTEQCTRKARILKVVYNASNNELVRTNTLVKNAVIQIDAQPFRQWYEQHYGEPVLEAKAEGDAPSGAVVGSGASAPSKKKAKQFKQRRAGHQVDPLVREQFKAGRIYACISSRPGQVGQVAGYVLEGEELRFYLKRINKK